MRAVNEERTKYARKYRHVYAKLINRIHHSVVLFDMTYAKLRMGYNFRQEAMHIAENFGAKFIFVSSNMLYFHFPKSVAVEAQSVLGDLIDEKIHYTDYHTPITS